MDTVTIVIGLKDIVVYQERRAGGRLYMIAPGLEIYKSGTVTLTNKDKVLYHCTVECQSRNINVFSLRKVAHNSGKSKTARTSDPFLSKLWDDLTDDEMGQLSHECSMCGKYTGSVDELGHCSTCRQIWNG